jgi:hypothetical protein
MWDYANLQATVDSFNAAVAGGFIPPPFLGPAPFTFSVLQMSLLHRMQNLGGGGGVVGYSLIAPNTMAQYADVITVANNLGNERTVRLPVGRVWVLADRPWATASRNAIVHPQPPGVALFE